MEFFLLKLDLYCGWVKKKRCFYWDLKLTTITNRLGYRWKCLIISKYSIFCFVPNLTKDIEEEGARAKGIGDALHCFNRKNWIEDGEFHSFLPRWGFLVLRNTPKSPWLNKYHFGVCEPNDTQKMRQPSRKWEIHCASKHRKQQWWLPRERERRGWERENNKENSFSAADQGSGGQMKRDANQV